MKHSLIKLNNIPMSKYSKHIFEKKNHSYTNEMHNYFLNLMESVIKGVTQLKIFFDPFQVSVHNIL